MLVCRHFNYGGHLPYSRIKKNWIMCLSLLDFFQFFFLQSLLKEIWITSREWLHIQSISIVSESHLPVWSRHFSIPFCSTNECLFLNPDLTGAQDGSVRMFEWTRPQQLVCFQQAGNARVTRMYFNSQGNKVSTISAIFYGTHLIMLWPLEQFYLMI